MSAGTRVARVAWRWLAGATVCAVLAVGASAGASPSRAATADDLLVSRTADRSGAIPLVGAQLTGQVFVFVREQTGVAKVSFWLDDPNRTGTATKIERNAPWDLAGTADNGDALGWNTESVTPGTHSIVARLDLTGGGSTTISASFVIGDPAPAVIATPTTLMVNASVDGAAVIRSVDVTAIPASTTVDVVSDQGWLTTANSVQAPGTLAVRIDPAGLPPGNHQGTLTLSAPSLLTAVVTIRLDVAAGSGAYRLMASPYADRHDAFPLDESAVSGGLHVFTTPDDGVQLVRFWIDNSTRSGSPYRSEKTAPFDLNGGSVELATTYDTRRLAEGPHLISAELTLASGAVVVTEADFVVGNSVSTPRAVFTPVALAVETESGSQPSTHSVTLAVSDGSVRDVSLSSDLPWVTATVGGATPTAVTVQVDARAIPPGAYSARVTAASPGITSTTLDVQIGVTAPGGDPAPPYELVVSASDDRSLVQPLEGAKLRGQVYVFVVPESGLSKVEFFIDDPTMASRPFKTESNPPWDLAGGSSSGEANPYDTSRLVDGAHSVTAKLTPPSGPATTIRSDFSVVNNEPVISVTPSPVALSLAPGGAADVDLNVRVTDGSSGPLTITPSHAWISVASSTVTTPTVVTVHVDAATLGQGIHEASVEVSGPGLDAVSVPITVHAVIESPDQVHLAHTGDAATQVTVTWRTRLPGQSWIDYRVQGAEDWTRLPGAHRPSGTTGQLWTAHLTGLTPDAIYEYRAGQLAAASATHTVRTVGATSPATAAFFADTGIVGRLDGLAVATARTVELLQELQPDVLLGAGDFAYYSTDKRYPTLDEAIDAWFLQMEPAAARAALMPSYGNHEILLGEGFEPWAARFPTPDGWSDRRAYSFDVGPFHFISLYAVSNTSKLTSAQTTWLRADIAAARAAGRPWIVPFMHVSAFAAGTNHKSNLAMRDQLGPIFESNNIRLVLQSHDQAYQRTWPITGLPAAMNIPSTATLGCVASGEGVVWLTVSPAGKLSNISKAFSPYAETPPPSWSAVRDNTRHHVATLKASGTGDLTVDVLGYDGSDAAPITTDHFRLSRGACG